MIFLAVQDAFCSPTRDLSPVAWSAFVPCRRTCRHSEVDSSKSLICLCASGSWAIQAITHR